MIMFEKGTFSQFIRMQERTPAFSRMEGSNRCGSRENLLLHFNFQRSLRRSHENEEIRER